MNPTLKGILLSSARHIAAVAVAWLAARGWIDTSPGAVDAVTQSAADAMVNIVAALIGVYAVFQKALKPVFFKWLGELMPGEVAPVGASEVPPTTQVPPHEAEHGEGDV